MMLISREEKNEHSRQCKRHRNGRVSPMGMGEHLLILLSSEGLEPMRGGRIWFRKVDWGRKGDKVFNLVSSRESLMILSRGWKTMAHGPNPAHCLFL